MQVINVFSVQVWDGGDRHNHRFYLDSKAEADKYMKDNKYDLIVPTTMEIFSSVEEWKEWKEGKVKERALAKLTAEERRALGF